MKSISLRQPWAYLLCAGIKDVENRTWKLPEKYKGEWILIHASAEASKNVTVMTDGQAVDCIVKLNARHHGDDNVFHPASCLYDAMLREGFPFQIFSAIVGAVKFSECLINADSIWAERNEYGKPIYNWKVSDAVLFDKPIPGVKGKLSFWEFDLPEDYQQLFIEKELANWIYYEDADCYYCYDCVQKRLDEINANKEFANWIYYEDGEECGFMQDYADEEGEVECCMCGKPLHSLGDE